MPIPWTTDQVVGEITARIERRAPGYLPGDQLPTYDALAAEFGISPMGAARVIRKLREAGIVVGVQGRGTFVAEEPGV